MPLARDSNNTFWFFSGLQLLPRSHRFPGTAMHSDAGKRFQYLCICNALFLTSNGATVMLWSFLLLGGLTLREGVPAGGPPP